MPEQTPKTNPTGSGEIVKQFQLTTDGIQKKSDYAFGLSLSKYIDNTVSSGLNGYYFSRNARFRKNRNYANGRIPVETMFADRFQMNAKSNYIKLNWQTLQIVNRIVSGLVGRWMSRFEKVQVTATDTISVKDKQTEFEQVEFIVSNRKMLEQLQQESGVQLIPEDENLPEDKDQLYLWQAQFQRLPEEILYELGCNDVLSANGWFDVLKEKMLHDAAEVLLVGTFTSMDEDGVIHVEWVQPENMIYSYSAYPDFRDTTWRGQIKSMKISEIRRKYGAEFGGKLTEEQLWDIASKAKEYTVSDKITWDYTWVSAFMRPYDEWNVDVIDFEFKTVDSEPYTVVTTKKNKSTIIKGGRGEKKENESIIEDTKWNIYRGVFIRGGTDVLLEWGLKKNMIRPQDPKEIGNAEFSYSFYMPQNYEMRNLAIPEKIEAAVDGMILALLKMQQVVARMRPTGAAIDESALQNIDYGLGDGNKDIDYKRLYDQTGDIYYRGVDAEGNRVPIPIQELANSGFLTQMQGLIANYQFNYQTLKDELGEDPNLISAALQPRVTTGNVETSQAQAEYATDYIYRAYSECMKMTARKVSCLLSRSVIYGSNAYRHILDKESLENRIFSTNIQFLPTANDIAKFEALMNQAIGSNPDLVLFIDPFQLMRVAKEDVKLAETLFRQGQKRMLQHRAMEVKQNQEATFNAQIESTKTSEQEKRQTEQEKGDIDIEKTKMQGESTNRNTVLASIMKMYETGIPIPPELRPLAESVLTNVALPAIVSNEETRNQIAMQMQAQAQMQQQQMQEQQTGQSINQPQQAA